MLSLVRGFAGPPVRLAAAILFCLWVTLPAPAAELRELEIPLDEKQAAERAFSDDPLVRIEPERLRDLLARYRMAVKASETATAAVTPPMTFSLLDAEYEGAVSGGGALVQATLRYHVLGQGPVALPVCFGDVAVESVSCRERGGPPAAVRGSGSGATERGPSGQAPRLRAPQSLLAPLAAIVEAKGPVTLQVGFRVPTLVSRGRSVLEFRTPAFPVKHLSLRLPRGAAGVSILSGAPLDLVAGKDPQGPLLTSELGSAPVAGIQWYSSSVAAEAAAPAPALARQSEGPKAPEQPPRVSAATASLFVVGDEMLSVRHEMQVLVTRGRVPSVDVTVPVSVEIQEVTGPMVADWSALVSGANRTLRVLFREPLRGETSLVLAGYQLLGSRDQVTLPIAHLSGAVRQQGSFGISSYCSVELEGAGLTSAGAQPIDPGDLPGSLVEHSSTPLLMAYRFTAATAPMTLGIRRFQPAPVLASLIENANAVTILTEVDRGGPTGKRQVTSFTKVILQLVNASRKYLVARMPAKARITSCFVGSEASSPAVGTQPGEYLVPVPRCRVQKGKLQAIPVQLTYQLDLDTTFADSGTVSYSLPAFDAPVADYSWKVFTPEKYRFLRFHGDLEDTSEDAEFIMVATAKWLFDRLLYDLVGKVLVGVVALVLVVIVIRGGVGALRTHAAAIRGVLTSLLIVVFILGGLAAISVPNFRAARERSNTRACFANQKTIAGAIEMYNLDNNCKQAELDGGFFDELVRGGYLQCIPDDPGQGPRSSSNYHMVEDGNGIACQVHGAISGGAAKVYGFTKDSAPAGDEQEEKPAGQQALAPGGPRDDRTNPINFRIPRTGQYTLLLRGFLPESQAPGFEVRYHSEGRFLQLRAICWVVGLILAILLVPPAWPVGLRPSGQLTFEAAALAVFVAILLAIDTSSPVLAGDGFAAWALGVGVAVVVAVFGAELKRLLGRLEEGGDER